MNTYILIQRYREVLGYPADQALELMAGFLDSLELQGEFKRYLRDETGVDLDLDDESTEYMGKPFAILAFHEGSDESSDPAERIDVDSEVLALEAFSTLLSRTDYALFIILQFNSSASTSRELLRYDRGASGQQW